MWETRTREREGEREREREGKEMEGVGERVTGLGRVTAEGGRCIEKEKERYPKREREISQERKRDIPREKERYPRTLIAFLAEFFFCIVGPVRLTIPLSRTLSLSLALALALARSLALSLSPPQDTRGIEGEGVLHTSDLK